MGYQKTILKLAVVCAGIAGLTAISVLLWPEYGSILLSLGAATAITAITYPILNYFYSRLA